MKSNWKRLLASSTIGMLTALPLVLMVVGYSRRVDAAMGMGGMMMSHGHMGQMMGRSPEPSDGPATKDQSADQVEGASVYSTTCSMCHASGAAGAPRYGDADAWAPRIKRGRQALYDHALHGFRGMPPKGGRTDLTDAQVEAAVDYMVKAAGGPNGQ